LVDVVRVFDHNCTRYLRRGQLLDVQPEAQAVAAAAKQIVPLQALHGRHGRKLRRVLRVDRRGKAATKLARAEHEGSLDLSGNLP